MKKNLVFTSAGDQHWFPDFWLNMIERKNFDLWVCYYGDQKNTPLQPHCDRYFEHKGGKFQNFLWVYQQCHEEMETYDAFFILDNDIQIGTNEINRLFDCLYNFDLWILQPAFSATSIVSHEVTKRIGGALLHFTNFVEMCVPLFSKLALQKFLTVYEADHAAFGVDFLYIWANGQTHKNRYAVVDEIICVNPEPPIGSQREVQRLGPFEGNEGHIESWNRCKESLGIKQWQPTTHYVLNKPILPSSSKIESNSFPVRSESSCMQIIDAGFTIHTDELKTPLYLNQSAYTIYQLCDGTRTINGIVDEIRCQLNLHPNDVCSLRDDVQNAVNLLQGESVIRLHKTRQQ
jgi:hypothetical protein